MIEPMKRITVVCLKPDRETTVARLRELGSVHVVHVHHPESTHLQELDRQLALAIRALVILQQQKSDKRENPAPAGALPPPDAVTAVNRLTAEIASLGEDVTSLNRAEKLLEPWDSFSRATLTANRERGLQIHLCTAPRDSLPVLPAGAILQPVKVSGDLLYFAVIAPAGIVLEHLPMAVLPEITDLGVIRERRQQAADGLAEKRRELAGLRPALDDIGKFRKKLESEIEFARARDGMGGEGKLVYLQGYLPTRQMPELSDAASRHGWALLSTDPDPEDLQVPTYLNLPKWVEPIRVVIDGIGILPGYREVDISAWFLLFFSIFFAMLIGDAAYGIILLAAVLVLRRKFPDAPSQPFWLFGIMAVATIIWGTLTGTWFGLESRLLPGVLNTLTVDYLTKEHNIQKLCFLLGAIHLTLAHLWNAWMGRKSLKCLGDLAWGCVLWGNYFLASNLVLDDPAPPIMVYLYIVGMTGIVLFSEPQRNPFLMVGTGLGKLVLGIVNSFIDVVSYIRLFAVGYAGLVIEQSFTGMAANTGMPGWLAVPAAALILIAGHGMNMILGALGVLVHGVRLNVLEFASHVGLQFSGVPYRPLKPAEPKAPAS